MRTFEFKARVYYSDTDAEGIIYHTRYLDFAEHARTEMLREALPDKSQYELAQGDDGIIIVVRSMNIEFRSAGHLDDELTVYTQMVDMQHFSCTFEQKIMRGETVLCEIKIKAELLQESQLQFRSISKWQWKADSRLWLGFFPEPDSFVAFILW